MLHFKKREAIPNNNTFPMRINKYIAHQGWTTRRQADEYILRKKVLINGKVAELGDKVMRDDKVELLDQNKMVQHDYFAYYKPEGETVNDDDTVLMDFLKKTKTFVANSLERDISGLIIVTNDGRLTTQLLHYNYEREYLIKTREPFKPLMIKKFKEGIFLDDEKTIPAKVKEIDEKTLSLTLYEEKSHQIKKMLSSYKSEADQIKRERLANITLRGLQPGDFKPIKNEEKDIFLNLIGLKAPVKKADK
ncbi:MAG: pseudouridine synthase [Minisyncoccia bacterium]